MAGAGPETEISHSSSLAIQEPEIEEYTWDFRIPPRSKLEKNIADSGLLNLGGHVFSGLEFIYGILSDVDHTWSATFYGNQISVRMDLQQRDDDNCRYTLKPTHIELISQKQVKCRHEMDFESCTGTKFTPKLIWYGTWTNDGSWDDAVDTVRVIFKACRDFGEFYNGIFTHKTFLEAKAEYASFMEQDLGDFFVNTPLADVNIICRGVAYAAHKVILTKRSSVFNEILSVERPETETITINAFSSEAMHEFLKFVYLGTFWSKLREDELCKSLVEMGHTYKVNALKLLCELQLTGIVTVEDAIPAFKEASCSGQTKVPAFTREVVELRVGMVKFVLDFV